MARKRAKKRGYFLAEARERMERKGTVGKFGRATASKIKRGLSKGGKEAKRAAFAKAMKTIAARRKKKSRTTTR